MGKIATRDAYGKALAEFGADERIVVLDADLSKSTKTATFKDAYPERHFNMGIAEGNMVSVAAGLASTGKVVFASSFAVFATGRAFEQIRNSVCYPNMNVKIAASHAGITTGEDGGTHQSIEDIAIMRALPNMRVMCPCDAVETRFAIKTAIESDGPMYIRLGRLAVDEFYEAGQEFTFGKGVTLKDYGNDVTIVATGLMVQKSALAAEMLKERGINAKLVDIHTIKPIDTDLLVKCAKETGKIVTVEEHNVIGGLGSAVCEALAENYPCKVLRIGMNDTFGKSGTPAELLKMFGLDEESIANKIEQFVK